MNIRTEQLNTMCELYNIKYIKIGDADGDGDGDSRGTQMTLLGTNRYQKIWPLLRRIGKIGFLQKNWKIGSTQKIRSQTGALILNFL